MDDEEPEADGLSGIRLQPRWQGIDLQALSRAITSELQSLDRGGKKNGSPWCSVAEPGESVLKH